MDSIWRAANDPKHVHLFRVSAVSPSGQVALRRRRLQLAREHRELIDAVHKMSEVKRVMVEVSKLLDDGAMPFRVAYHIAARSPESAAGDLRNEDPTASVRTCIS